jgi:hypothetical protein
VSALTRLAPVTIEKDYAKTMACVKEAVSSAELYEDPDAVSRAAQQAELKACVDNLRAIASQKKLVTASGDVDGPDASVPDL